MPKVFVNLGPRTFERNSQGGSGDSATPVGVGAAFQRLIPTESTLAAPGSASSSPSSPQDSCG